MSLTETISADLTKSMKAGEKLKTETLRTILGVLETTIEITPDVVPSLLSQMEEKTGRKGKTLYGPLRAGITGKTKGPELVKILSLLGKERMVKRLKMALAPT